MMAARKSRSKTGTWNGMLSADAVLDTVRAELRGFREDLGDLRQDFRDMKQEVGDLKQEVGDLKQEVGDLKQDVGDLKQEVGGLKQDVAGLKEGFVELKEEVGELRRDMTAGFERVDRELLGVKADIGRLQVAVLGNTREIQELRVVVERKVDRDEVEGVVERVVARSLGR
jgi:chromosome segregation ATPase